MSTNPVAALSEVAELTRCRAVFIAADPARLGHVAFWRADGTPPPLVTHGSPGELAVVLPGGGCVEQATVPSVSL
ncbi:MAG TPA: hypothetical protein VLG91_06015, partial [Streptomyces sp.]|nr:hypothetical protein [Streptomyces sp.]